MKRLLLPLALLILSAPLAAQTVFFVAPAGDDLNPGTEARPFQTLEHARDAVRALKQAGPLAAPVTITLRGGLYSLSQPLQLTPADSGTATCPVTYTAYKGEQPVLSGGRRITGWTPHTNGLWKASLPAVKSGEWYFRDLFVRPPGQVEFERRYRPTRGLFVIAGLTDGPVRHPGRAINHRNSQREFYYHPGDLQRFQNLSEVELVVTHDWSSGRFTIEELDEQNHLVRLTDFPHYRIGHWYPGGRNPYLVENVKEDLGKPGQWYLDRPTGILYYRPLPGEDVRTLTVVAPVHERLLQVTGDAPAQVFVEHLSFRGLTFAHTNWAQAPHKYAEDYKRDCRQGFVDMPAALEFAWSRNCSLQACTLANTGSYALDFGEACHNNTLTASLLYDCGTGGVKIGVVNPSAQPPLIPTGNAVENCFITDTGVVHYSGHGIWGGYTAGARIRHNVVRRSLYSPIAVGWSHNRNETPAKGHLIEYNHVYDTMLLLDHGGALYTLGYQPGTVLRGNLVHDTHQTKLHGKVKRPDWTAGAFAFDDGSSGFIVEDNIVYNLPVPPELPLTAQADRHTIGKNYLGIAPGQPGFPTALAARAGLEPAYRQLAHKPPRVTAPPILSLDLPANLRPLRISDDFERATPGAAPSRAYVRVEDKDPGKGTDAIKVTDQTAATGKHSLLIQDAPDLSRNWLPYLSYNPAYQSGMVSVTFNLRVGAGAHLDHAWRGSAPGREFSVGPQFFVRDGGLFVGEQKLAEFPPDTWINVTVRCQLGKPDPGIGGEGLKGLGVWSLRLRAPGGPEQLFDDLKIGDKDFSETNWIGFVSLATEKTEIFLDDLDITNQ